jgi:hypothetical protein
MDRISSDRKRLGGTMKRREFIRAGMALAVSSLSAGTARGLRIEIWNGLHHRIGHLGTAQDDFNLLGHVYATSPIARVTCSVNGDNPKPLQFNVFRRIVQYGDFNADIPLASLPAGDNRIIIQATDTEGRASSADVTITRVAAGTYPLPARINWASVRDLEEVALCTDGRWTYGPKGLRTAEIGYDRVLLIGNRLWKDYEVTAPVTIHSFSRRSGPQSSAVHHAGFCLRWTGHSTEENAPGDQPKWGLHPRGGVVWVTSRDGSLPMVRQFYPGDSEQWQTFAPFPIQFGRPFWMKGRCETLVGDGATRYSFKVWNTAEQEPRDWDFRVTQRSDLALRSGGLALLAHETDVTFGDLVVTDLPLSGLSQ